MNVCYYGTEALSQRTLSPDKDYKTSEDYKRQTPALYFPYLIPSGLPPPPRSSFLKRDDLPRGIITNKGLNKKTLLFVPLLPHFLIILSLHPSFHPVLFMESISHFLKYFHLLLFISSILPYCCPYVFPQRSAMCNGSCHHNIPMLSPPKVLLV